MGRVTAAILFYNSYVYDLQGEVFLPTEKWL